MNTPRTTSVKLLDKEYVIACPQESEAQLLAAADYLKNKMQEIKASGRIIGLEKIAVMAALNISHELLHSSQGNEEQLQQRLQQLSAKIDQGLNELEP